MKRVSDILSMAIKIAGLTALICSCLLILSLRAAIQEVRSNVHQSGLTVQAIAGDTRARLFGKGEVFDIAKATMLHVDRITGETAILARQQHTATAALNTKLDSVIGHADATVKVLENTIQELGFDLHTVTGDTHTVLTALAHDIDDIDPVLRETRKAIADLDANLINDPDIKRALAELANVTTNVDSITGNLNKMSVDAANKFHHLLTDKPTVKARILLALKVAYQIALIKAAFGQ